HARCHHDSYGRTPCSPFPPERGVDMESTRTGELYVRPSSLRGAVDARPVFVGTSRPLTASRKRDCRNASPRLRSAATVASIRAITDNRRSTSATIRSCSARGGIGTAIRLIMERFRLGWTPPEAVLRMSSYWLSRNNLIIPLRRTAEPESTIAAIAWFVVASNRSSEVFPRVLPSPYIATSNVPGG